MVGFMMINTFNEAYTLLLLLWRPKGSSVNGCMANTGNICKQFAHK